MVRVKAYRTTIVTATPAAYLRQRIADTMGPLTDGIIVDGKTVFKWTFWDEIKAPNLKDIAPLDPAATSTRELELKYAQEPLEHFQEMRRIIKLIHESRVSTIARLKGGPLEHNVALAAEALVEVVWSNQDVH